MRLLLFVFLILIIFSSAFAQVARQGAYAEAGVASCGIMNKSVVMGKVSFGWRIIPHGIIGGMYSFSPRDFALSDYIIAGFSYGGLFAEYDIPISAPLGLRFQILAAGGGLRFSDEGMINFLIYEPAVMLDYKISSAAAISAGFSYGFAAGIDEQTRFSTNDLSKYRIFISTRYGIAIFPDAR